MKLRTKYILFVTLLHLTALGLSYFIFRDNKVLFIVAEVVIIISVVISWRLYSELLKPLKLLMQGAETIKDKDFNVKMLPTGKYEMDQLIGVYNKMMDELRAERIRQEQQHLFLEKLINTSPTGIIILDYDENIHQVNPKALQLLDVQSEDLLSKPIATIAHPVAASIARLPTGQSETVTVNNVSTFKIQKSHFIDRGFARQFIMIEELTAEILAAEKKAYGKVIRMMAHEVNNTIGPVNSILQSALGSPLLLQEKNGELLQNALQVAVDRNHNLNHFMRNFADVVRLPEPVRQQIDLHQLLQSITELMKLKAREKDIQFIYERSEEPFFIDADRQQMEQVLINIIKNSIEAIEEKGTVCFNTYPAGKKLVITDSGHGISPAAAEQLFSPFFSTRRNGQGIGLTLIKEVLLNHGFNLSLRTEAPGRTEFVIEFDRK
jgi:two-component system, NtrC family, nitrogen regulation sensor histidine kinase NtrY